MTGPRTPGPSCGPLGKSRRRTFRSSAFAGSAPSQVMDKVSVYPVYCPGSVGIGQAQSRHGRKVEVLRRGALQLSGERNDRLRRGDGLPVRVGVQDEDLVRRAKDGFGDDRATV